MPEQNAKKTSFWHMKNETKILRMGIFVQCGDCKIRVYTPKNGLFCTFFEKSR